MLDKLEQAYKRAYEYAVEDYADVYGTGYVYSYRIHKMETALDARVMYGL